MLTINLSPVRSDEPQPKVSYAAPVLTVDGIDYDLSELPDGATAEHPVLGQVSRTGSDYELTLRLPHGPRAPEITRFPVPIEVNVDGPIELPPYDEVEDELDSGSNGENTGTETAGTAGGTEESSGGSGTETPG
tara:strand:- start:40540 stop:40941 length:402 start_codon:yes stop_codon:yes gene_type:complete